MNKRFCYAITSLCFFSSAVVALPTDGGVASDLPIVAAEVVLGNLISTYNGLPQSATCDTVPVGLATSLTYSNSGSGVGHKNAGQYTVTCTVTEPGYSGSSSGILVINKRSLAINGADVDKIYDSSTLTGGLAGATITNWLAGETIISGDSSLGGLNSSVNTGNLVTQGGSLVGLGSISIVGTNSTAANYSISATATQWPSFSAVELNRVTSIDPSIILGLLQSNGKVFLINPVGTLFDASAIADLNGAVPSTTTVSNIGWNFLGNSTDTPLDVATTFSDTSQVSSVWKWNPATRNWAFYSPSLAGEALADYAGSKGYDLLTVIRSGEGFWVNAKTPFAFALPAGQLLSAQALQPTLSAGWNMVAVGQNVTPSEFNSAFTLAPPTPGVTPTNLNALWAWDNAQSNWYFYAPSLHAKGGTALADYVKAKGFLDFSSMSKQLSPGMGFWVHQP
jgi:filamentous hemagglutinin family protein